MDEKGKRPSTVTEATTADSTPPSSGGLLVLTISEDDSIDTVLNALKVLSDDQAVVSQALDSLFERCGIENKASSSSMIESWLQHYVTGDIVYTRSTVKRLGGIPLVIAAMQKHPELEEKARRALLALLPIRPADGVQKVLETMNKVRAILQMSYVLLSVNDMLNYWLLSSAVSSNGVCPGSRLPVFGFSDQGPRRLYGSNKVSGVQRH